ncbi:hypothetical protein EUGRSUZ_G01818 [Eucalyptus grandis]|uniref:Uncharacterized protein n=2 Tax=Eucalyptus grandis TaxID=71139 RepID=A0ACC3K3S0_EUCGR|nr:hypothetical protein EUGRSUZ_G01818 [Eucalyptus grandis]
MMEPKKLMKMVRMWEKIAASGRRRISDPGVTRGHFVIYTTDGRRFMIPLQFTRSNIFKEHFEMSEEEFRLSGDGPITVPCDAASMEYIVSFVERCVAKDIENALLNSIPFTPCTLASALHNKLKETMVTCIY